MNNEYKKLSLQKDTFMLITQDFETQDSARLTSLHAYN